jgi:DNA-binding LytR/AlgR family response regulator
MKVNCIIVDDEPAAREILERYVSRCDALHLAAICSHAFEAAEALKHHEVQLIFLDINMPRLSGMQFYRSLTNPPFVIFTTAYPEFAVEGFEVNAVDFLLKPYPFNRFETAVNKAIEIIRSKTNHAADEAFILLKSDKKIYRINLSDILHIKAVGDYVQVYFGEKSILVHSTFQNLLNQLPPDQVVRVHKSHAIALNKVESIDGNIVRLSGKDIPVGLSYRAAFMDKMSGGDCVMDKISW